ncbi:MAG: YhcN/YlaJ family sporulation lipoprotein [Clostridia bacterium]|nr:YhcN/YlaJ family sporulation lipoprotein [Clostridia bacterium]
MKKIGYFGCLLLVAALTLTGCAGNADTLSSPTPGNSTMMPSTSPGTENNTSPNNSALTTQMPILSDMQEGVSAMMGLTSLKDVQTASEEMEDAVEQLSEVDDAYVIAYEDKALVGLQMNDQYQGGVDERLEKMVLGRVQTIEKSITGVYVTDDAAKVQEIEKLTEQLDNAQDLSQVTAAMESMLTDMTVYQE